MRRGPDAPARVLYTRVHIRQRRFSRSLRRAGPDAIPSRADPEPPGTFPELPAGVELLIGEDLTLACLEAEYAFLDSNQRSGGDAFSCGRLCSAVSFASLVFTRCSDTLHDTVVPP